MTVQAYTSGRLGKALFVDQGRRWIIEPESEPREPTIGEVSELFSAGAETKCFLASNSDAVRSRLHDDVLFQDALFMFLSCCDPDLSLSTKIVCAQELEPLLEDEALGSRLISRLLSKPMPLASRAVRHETVTLFASFDLLVACLRRVFGKQEWCDEVAAAWQGAAKGLPADRASELEAELTEDGTLAAIVEAASTGELHRLNDELVSQSLRNRDPEISQSAKEALLRIGGSLRAQLRPRLRQQQVLPLRRGNRTRRAENQDLISGAIERAREPEYPPRFTSVEAKTRVDKQIEGIRDALFRGRDDLAERFIADLVNFQLSNSEKDHLAKSLCNLAAISLDANSLDMADRLSTYALGIEINDPVVFTTRAEVLKNLGSFAASLAAFKEATARFPSSDYAWVGVADVLREMGEYEQSLAAYTEAQGRFPDAAVAFNGYLTVLRAQGKRDAAVKYALEIVQKFPGDAVSRANLGAALRDRGKYSDAIRQYQASLKLDGTNTRTILGYASTLSLTPAGSRGALELLDDRLRIMQDNSSLENAKAIYLRRTGLFAESLRTADEIIRAFPSYTPAHFNRAATLLAMGRTEEAVAGLPDPKVLRSELDWSSPRIYSLALVAQGRFAEAAQKLQDVLSDCPWRGELARARTTLGYVQMKQGKSAESIKTLQHNLSLVPEATRQVRLVLLGGAQVMSGNYSVAESLLRKIVSARDNLLNPVREKYITSINQGSPVAVEITDQSEIQLLLAA